MAPQFSLRSVEGSSGWRVSVNLYALLRVRRRYAGPLLFVGTYVVTLAFFFLPCGVRVFLYCWEYATLFTLYPPSAVRGREAGA